MQHNPKSSQTGGNGRRLLGMTSTLLVIACGAVAIPVPALRNEGGQRAAPIPAYPLRISANRRYLVDQKRVPFLIAGDAPQALTVNLSTADAETYFANRAFHGFNTMWINLVCNDGTGGRKDGTTYDGIAPFTTPGDLSTPNETYFARCDQMIRLAGKHGLMVLLDPIETAGWLKTMLANGVAKCRTYGQYLGQRYRSYPNILWMNGNDFQTWRDAGHDAVVTAVAEGIRDRDSRHLHTVELDYLVSSSQDDPKWAPILGLNAAYTYYPCYAEVLKDYNRSDALPVVMIESDYEQEQHSTPVILRRQEYWTNLSGATGQVYGHGSIWPFRADWKRALDSPGAVQMAYLQALFTSRRWWELVPDQSRTLVTAGYGTFDATHTDANRYVMASDYVTAARTPDGGLAMAYMPTLRDLTVDMTRLRGPVAARWYDPSRGIFLPIAGSPFPNSGTHLFTPPGTNGDGNGDWVLLLEALPRRQ